MVLYPRRVTLDRLVEALASKMQIDGPRRTEEWTESQHRKAEGGKAWKTTASGTAEKT